MNSSRFAIIPSQGSKWKALEMNDEITCVHNNLLWRVRNRYVIMVPPMNF
jgi:hypothetical protein